MIPSTPKVAYVGLVRNLDERTWRVSLRDARGYIIKDETGMHEMSDHTKRIAEKEAKRLAKAYGVNVKIGSEA